MDTKNDEEKEILIQKKKDQLEESNRSKYGDKDFDIISQCYRVSKEQGDVWCIGNIFRYLDRFKRPNSSKGNNLTDLIKARDYMERLIEKNIELLDVKEEIIER